MIDLRGGSSQRGEKTGHARVVFLIPYLQSSDSQRTAIKKTRGNIRGWGEGY
jgi:hypothetical protein